MEDNQDRLNSYNLYNEAREFLKKLARDFKESDFFVEENQSNEILSIKNFSNEKGAVSTAIETAKIALDIPSDVFISQPTQKLFTLKGSAQKTYEALQDMRAFHQKIIDKSDLSDAYKIEDLRAVLLTEKQGLLAKFESAYSLFSQAISPLMYWGVYNRLNAKTETSSAANAIKPHSGLFRIYAWSHFFAAIFWLAIGVSLFILTVLYSHYGAYAEIKELLKSKMTWQRVLSLAILNLFALGMLVSMTFWSLRNYAINKHNELTNRIKSASLRSYGDFSETVYGHRELHGVVIRKILDTVFDLKTLGYMNDKNNDDKTQDKLLDFLLAQRKEIN